MGEAPKTLPVFNTKRIDTAWLGTDNQHRVRVGDIVHFDWGGNNWGIIYDIVWNRGGEVLFIRNNKGFGGEWLEGKTEFRFPAEHCWIEK